MSSHREAPEISKDPVADSADLYAFVSPDDPDTVTIIANYVPLQLPASGPNFFEFGDDVLYEIHIDSNGDARPDLTYQFRFRTELRNDKTSRPASASGIVADWIGNGAVMPSRVSTSATRYERRRWRPAP